MARMKGRSMRCTSLVHALMVGSMAVVTACAQLARYGGIDLRPGRAAGDLQELARAAQAGDKQAQYALGQRYEAGVGGPRDQPRAIALYTLAARDSGGPLQIYSPAVGSSPGRVERIDRPIVPGLPEARARLLVLGVQR